MKMNNETVEIKSRLGLHMRPAAEVAKLASGFDAIIALYKEGNIAHAHSVVELLTLGAFHGDTLKVTAVGNEAEAALEAVVGYFDSYSDTDINEAA